MEHLLSWHDSKVSCCVNEPGMVLQHSFEEMSLQEDLTVSSIFCELVYSCDKKTSNGRDKYLLTSACKSETVTAELALSHHSYDWDLHENSHDKVKAHSSQETRKQLPQTQVQDGFDDLN